MQSLVNTPSARISRSLRLAMYTMLSIGLGIGLTGCEGRPAVESVETFLARHWQTPLPPQGAVPSAYSALEASLSPEACGTCHVEQLQQWRGALHSHTMGAGIRWQYELLGQDESNRCLRCHAPLAEQKALVALEMAWPNAPKTPPPDYVPASLAASGLSCAACHVRGHQRFGPPKRANQDQASVSAKAVPHAGFIAAAAFQDSRFCAHCHQFPEEGPRLAGKLREDTYGQWLSSPYAGKQPCQACHMPERRHLWRGIHDPDMLRKALAVQLKLSKLASGEYQVEIVARNQGAGHHLPTYMVPKLDLVLSLVRSGTETRELARDVIGWKADATITREEFDSRLPAGASRSYRHVFPAPDRPGWHLELRVDVAPREHYERMFRHSLINLSLSKKASDLLKEAIAEAEATRYTAMRLTAQP
jgi:hypothetical protein